MENIQQRYDMKRTSYTHNNITLEEDNGAWWLTAKDKLTGFDESLAIEQSEIASIADVCMQMLEEWGERV